MSVHQSLRERAWSLFFSLHIRHSSGLWSCCSWLHRLTEKVSKQLCKYKLDFQGPSLLVLRREFFINGQNGQNNGQIQQVNLNLFIHLELLELCGDYKFPAASQWKWDEFRIRVRLPCFPKLKIFSFFFILQASFSRKFSLTVRYHSCFGAKLRFCFREKG